MPLTAIIAILVSVTMSALAQIALKTGMASPRMAEAIAGVWDKPAAEVNGHRLWLTDKP